MKARLTTQLLGIIALLFCGCGQDEAVFPENNQTFGTGVCGSYYPGADDTDGDVYGVEEGKVFPCPVWLSVRLDGQDTYLNIGDQYLKRREGVGGPKSIVIVISAERCTNCSKLIVSMIKRKAEFDDAGALMIAMARRDLLGLPNDPDFDLDKAEEVLDNEGWPIKSWYLTNDEEHYFSTTYDEATPWVIVVDTTDMVVVSNSNDTFSPNDAGADKLLQVITSF